MFSFENIFVFQYQQKRIDFILDVLNKSLYSYIHIQHCTKTLSSLLIAALKQEITL